MGIGEGTDASEDRLMVTPVRLTAEADEDWHLAVDWYESVRSGLGLEFSVELEAAVMKIAGNPQCGSYLMKRLGIRRVLLKRFPYKIIYHLTDEAVEVISIFGERQHPHAWQRRIGKGGS